MALVEFAFTAGLDQGTDPRRTVKLTSLSNYVWNKRGIIEKRPGYQGLTVDVLPTANTSSVASVTVTSGGSGYTHPLFFVLGTGGGGAGFVGIASANASGVVTAVTLVGSSAPGYGYTSPPTLLWNEPGIGGGSGVGAAATVTLTTPSGAAGVLANTYTLCTTPQGQLQVTDGSKVYAYSASEGGWEPLGALTNIAVTTTPTPIFVQTVPVNDASGNAVESIQAINPFVVSCGSNFVWWPTGPAIVQDQGSGAFIATNKGVVFGTPGLDVVSQVVTDGVRWTWQFQAGQGGSGQGVQDVSFIPLDSGTAAPPQQIGLGYVFPNPITDVAIEVDTWFDCVYDIGSSRLIAAYVVHSSSNITFSTWTWDPIMQVWVASAISGTVGIGSGFTAVLGLAVNVGPNTGNIYMTWAWADGSGNVKVTAAMRTGGVTSSSVIYSAPSNHVTNSITNLSVCETSNGADWHVAFTAIDVLPQAASTNRGFANTIHSVGLDFQNDPVTMTITQGCGLATRLYQQGGRPHALAYNPAALSYVILDLTGVDPWNITIGFAATPATALALINPRVAFGALSNFTTQLYMRLRGTMGTLPTVVSLATDEWMIPTTIAPEPGSSALMALQQCVIKYNTPPAQPAIEWTSMSYPGSIPRVVGTNTVHEDNFMQPPTIVAVVGSGSGGLGAGSYTWVATYARINDDGSITESPPSQPWVTSATSGAAAQVFVTTYGLGGLQGGGGDEPITGAYVLLYRSLVNAGDTLFRASADPFTAGSAVNDTRYPSVVIGDSASDAQIGSNPQLYTNGGVFQNVCPPACSFKTRIRDRIYLAGTPDQRTVYYSDSIQNTGTTNYHDEQTIVTDDDGPITAIGALDSNTFVFKSDAVYVVYGTEGNDTGANNNLTNPARVPTGGIGCISANSVVEIPQGLMFQSARGIELLDRNLSVTFIGEPVKDVTVGTVVSALVVATQYQVRFFLSGGAVIVYSTTTGEWSTFSYPHITTGTTSATLNNGLVTWCSVGTTIQQETPSTYSDAGNWITSSFATGQLTLGQGLEGYRRYKALQILGTWNGQCGLTLSISSNYAATPQQVETRSSAQLAQTPGLADKWLQLEVYPAIPKAEAIQITVTDSPPSPAVLGRGIAWESVTVETYEKTGRYRGLGSASKG